MQHTTSLSDSIDAFARMAALATRVPDPDVLFYSNRLSIEGLTPAAEKNIAYAATLLAEGALALLSDGDTAEVTVEGLTRTAQGDRATEAGSWILSITRAQSFSLPDPDTIPLPTLRSELRPFLSQAINDVPGVLLSAHSDLASGFVARHPQHTPFTMATQLLAFALIDHGVRAGTLFTEDVPASMQLLAAKTGTGTGVVLDVAIRQIA